MFIQFKKCVFNLSRLILIFIIAGSVTVVAAPNNSAKDKELIIAVDPATNCAIYVAPSQQESNCAVLYPADKNPCKNDPECVCSTKEKYITWHTSTGNAFDIHFTHGSPFKQCEYSSGSAGEVRCKIKNEGDYYYQINVVGCANNPYDPRIVVK